MNDTPPSVIVSRLTESSMRPVTSSSSLGAEVRSISPATLTVAVVPFLSIWRSIPSTCRPSVAPETHFYHRIDPMTPLGWPLGAVFSGKQKAAGVAAAF
jgi:hypothetical protein